MQTLTFNQLLKLTVVQECTKCNLKHALARSCEDAQKWQEHLDGQK